MVVFSCARPGLSGLATSFNSICTNLRRGRCLAAIAVALLLTWGTASAAQAQSFPDPYGQGAYGGDAYGGGAYGASGGAGKFQTGLAGDYWIGGNGNDRGLGYRGSYVSAGAVVPMFDDHLWGTWIFDGRGHYSENQGFFSNIGLMRRQYIGSKVMIGAGAFFDYDGDQADTYAHTYKQVGVSGELLMENFEGRVNGYIPIDPKNDIIGYTNTSYYQNNILLQQGISAAFGGVDSTFGFALPGLDSINAVARFGGYHYEADTLDPINGFMAQLDFTVANSLDILTQINHDDRFDTTGYISLAYHFGGSPRKTFSQAIDRPVRRNDHIVRVQQDAIYALNPANNLERWRVIHVDNTAAPGGNGTYEHPVNNLTDADNAAWHQHDIILVSDGDRTSTGYDTGITLDNYQHLLGDGLAYTINTQAGAFDLETSADGYLPLFTNPAGAGVQLASFNEVAGIGISQALVGIQGTGVASAYLHDNAVRHSVGNGVELTNMIGHSVLDNNTADQNGGSGVAITQTAGSSSYYLEDNNLSSNTVGLNILADGGNVDAALTRNALDDNAAKGAQITARNGADVQFAMYNGTVDRNGISTGAGTGLTYEVDDSTLTSVVQGNSFLNNAGGQSQNPITEATAIRGEFTGNSVIDLTLRGNTFNGGHVFGAGLGAPVGFFVELDYDLTNTTVSNLLVEDNLMAQSSSASFILNVGNTSTVDFTFQDNTVRDGVHDALLIQTGGNALLQANILRNNILHNIDVNSTGSINRDNAVNLRSLGASRMIVYLDQNTITQTAEGLVIDPDPTIQDGHGLNILASNTSFMIVEATNNTISDGGNSAVVMQLNNQAHIVGMFRDNIMANNASPDETFLAQVNAGASATGFLTLELTNNLAANGFQLTKSSVNNIFFFENGGGNIGPIDTTGTIINVAPGTTQALATPLQVFP